MRWKVAGVLMLMCCFAGCSNDVHEPDSQRRVTVNTPRGEVTVEDAIRNPDGRYVTANVVRDDATYTLRVQATGNGGAVSGGIAELLDDDGKLLFSLETLVNNETGEVTYRQATSEDYLTQTILSDDNQVIEHYDVNGDVATFEYPALSEEAGRHAANNFRHGMPVSDLPPDVRDFTTALERFDAYYEPHSTSTLHDNPSGELLVEILASPDLKGLVDTVESTRWKWIETTCLAARACQSLMCFANPASLVCFACATISTACTILDVVCRWLGC